MDLLRHCLEAQGLQKDLLNREINSGPCLIVRSMQQKKNVCDVKKKRDCVQIYKEYYLQIDEREKCSEMPLFQ